MHKIKHILLFLLIFTSCIAFSLESLNCDCIAPANSIRKFKQPRKVTCESESFNPNKVAKIHSGYWPHFCVKHLIEEPFACSSWSDRDHVTQLDFHLFGSAEAYFDPELIEQISFKMHLIPTSHKLCNYGWCTKCGQTLKLGASYCETYDDDDNEILIPIVVYKCECLGDIWIDKYDDDNDYEIEEIIDNWKFCRSPASYPGYVDWQNKLYFNLLVTTNHEFIL